MIKIYTNTNLSVTWDAIARAEAFGAKAIVWTIGAPAIYISNHGGRQLDYSPSPLEIAYEIYRNAPQVFEQVEVMADSGVRYGSDVIKLLALGVKMVGLGRS